MSYREGPSKINQIVETIEESAPYQALESGVARVFPDKDSLVARGIVVGLIIALAFVLCIFGISSCVSCTSGAQSQGVDVDVAQVDDEAAGTTKLDVLTRAAVQPAKVIEVIDGDTLRVKLGRGYREGEVGKVRLIGIDTPESVHPDESKNTEAGVAASEHVKSLLHEGDDIWLTADVSDVDKYGRWLRYVWIKDPCDADGNLSDKADPKQDMLNALLVKDGYAEAKEFPPDTSYADLFHSL